MPDTNSTGICDHLLDQILWPGSLIMYTFKGKQTGWNVIPAEVTGIECLQLQMLIAVVGDVAAATRIL